MEQLRFDNPVFSPGLNYTVRLGEKWKHRVAIGDFVEIVGWLGYAKIKHIFICPLGDIPEMVLRKEHDPDCRTWEGLAQVLQKAYPELADIDSEVLENTTVTCLGFLLYKAYTHKEMYDGPAKAID